MVEMITCRMLCCLYIYCRGGVHQSSPYCTRPTQDSSYGVDTVAFTAQFSTNTSVSWTAPMLYDDVIYNFGNDYNNSAGEFTCQESGLYLFSVSTHSMTYASYGQMNRNDALEGYTSHSSNRWDASLDGGSATLTRMLYCNATDIITVTSLGDYDYMAEVIKVGPLTGQPPNTITFKSSSTQTIVQCQIGQTVYVEAIVIGSSNHLLHHFFTNFLGFQLPRF